MDGHPYCTRPPGQCQTLAEGASMDPTRNKVHHERPPWPRVLSAGRWIEVTPGWILCRLQEGLTPRTADIIALAADQIGLSVEQMYGIALAFVALESEAQP